MDCAVPYLPAEFAASFGRRQGVTPASLDRMSARRFACHRIHRFRQGAGQPVAVALQQSDDLAANPGERIASRRISGLPRAATVSARCWSLKKRMFGGAIESKRATTPLSRPAAAHYPRLSHSLGASAVCPRMWTGGGRPAGFAVRRGIRFFLSEGADLRCGSSPPFAPNPHEFPSFAGRTRRS